MSFLIHSRVKMTSAGGNLHVCSINHILSRSFHKHLCPNAVALLSQCILLSGLLRGAGILQRCCMLEDCQLFAVPKRYRSKEY